MKTIRLLQTLDKQLANLTIQAAPLAEHTTLGPRFDRQLFRTRTTLMADYLAEAQHNFIALRQAVEQRQQTQVAWLAERLAAQMAAIRRECATWSLRGWDGASEVINRWQRKRLRHQEYERRLLEMRDVRQHRLAQAITFDEQQRLAHEVVIYDGRLARCREALDRINNVLARLTR